MLPRHEPGDEPMIARDATYHKASDTLRARIASQVAAEKRARRTPSPLRWGGFAIAATLAGLLTWNGLLLRANAHSDERVAAEIESAHVRSLLVESHLNDVASSDQHTVKPWFQGKLNFAPQVTDLQEGGFTLVGGRLDYVKGRPVAALTYRHRLHVVNVFEWPADEATEAAPVLTTRDGYAIVRWRHAGLELWAISDAAGADLLQLAALLQK